MKGKNVIFSSNHAEWSTPQNFFNSLDAEFHFNLDPCASELNYKCEKYYTREENGLNRSWGGYRVFCNPPYGKEIARWVEKCYKESQKDNTLIVLLIPARTDTSYFHNYIYHHAEIRFLRGRLKFGGSKYNAPFPSMVVIFRSPTYKKESVF